MATVNNRVGIPQAIAINGVDVGGAMSARITAGHDNLIRSAPDGLEVPIKDKEIEFVRGVVVTQDWVHALDLLTGALGTYVFYERKSGVAAATGYVEHTITAPVIHRMTIDFTKGGYGTVTFEFECRPADETKGIADMWVMADDEAAPTYVSSARGGFRIESCKHDPGGDGEIQIYHLTGFTFGITMPLVRECNDGDVGYTCVDARLDAMTCEGSITFQDAEIATGAMKAQQLIVATKADLAIQARQSQGATSKVITIANADFNSVDNASDVNAPFTEYTAAFDVANDAAAPLTLSGDNTIIAIADVV